MPNDWFSPEIAPMFSLLSLTAAVSALDHFARRGLHKPLVTITYAVGAAAGLLLLAAGLVALAVGQRWFVIFPLTFAGAVMTVMFLWSLLDLKRIYSDAELRRSLARDI